MSFHDVVFGEGEVGNSWTSFKYNGNVSRGQYSYRVQLEVFDLSVTVLFTHKMGKALKEKLEAGVSEEAIVKWLTPIALRKVTLADMRERIEWSIQSAYEKGRQDKAAEVRSVLGVY